MGQYIARLQDVPDLASLTPSANAVLFVSAYASSTATWSYISSVNSAVLVTSAGGVPSFSTTLPAVSGANLTSLAAGNISTGTLAVARGGTGLGSWTTGDVLYASASGTLAGLADVATGSVLK